MKTKEEILERYIELEYDQVLEAMEEYGKMMYNQALEDAAQNVKIAVFPDTLEEWEIVPDVITREHLDDEESGCDEGFTIEVNKNSILKLKK